MAQTDYACATHGVPPQACTSSAPGSRPQACTAGARAPKPRSRCARAERKSRDRAQPAAHHSVTERRSHALLSEGKRHPLDASSCAMAAGHVWRSPHTDLPVVIPGAHLHDGRLRPVDRSPSCGSELEAHLAGGGGRAHNEQDAGRHGIFPGTPASPAEKETRPKHATLEPWRGVGSAGRLSQVRDRRVVRRFCRKGALKLGVWQKILHSWRRLGRGSRARAARDPEHQLPRQTPGREHRSSPTLEP